MKLFAELFADLDQTNKTNTKLAVLERYLKIAPDKDKLWLLALFTHKRPARSINSTVMRRWAAEYAQVPGWLFEECYHIVGDLAEAIALILPEPDRTQDKPLSEWIAFLQSLEKLSDEQKKPLVIDAWQQMTTQERFLLIKLMTGNFRIGVSQNLMTRAVADATGQDKAVVAHRLMGNWHPREVTYEQLIFEENATEHSGSVSQPYPFLLAHALDSPPEELGLPGEWQVEWKWDGIRGQIVVRQRQLFTWSRGEDLVTEKFPEFLPLLEKLPDGTVLDGEILPFINNVPMPFAELQKRIGRKNITKKILQEVPVVFVAYDLLEWQGQSVRHWPLAERRAQLEQLAAQVGLPDVLQLSRVIAFENWEELKKLWLQSREYVAEGMMLKRKASAYGVGRVRGDWWKWKVEPLSIDGVLIYAQKGHGKRADLFTDYTFGVWQGDQLVTFTKAYSGLTDAEIREVDNFVKRNTLEKFGPVRTVKPELVFEIGFEGIQASSRHKSGVALRFPRILRWRKDKNIAEANTLTDLLELLNSYK